MLSPADKQIINQRIDFFTQKKSELLSQRKSERTESIQEIDRRISRLKGWLK